ncbi:MAG TPA: type II toxin-antitoxin system VapC family toxin [Deltaproteobacteria bacterium]|jgi:predicted nucleic acid-binding protein|nr:type II toxin-antitoxin system VapC family toxin [Deltaproteobacteria bacterium]|tara:strand:- start:700 stop:1074 length:375 start_codon:yes stop_codon:yes gene_type:complete
MVLVDTSVWIDHLRVGHPNLVSLLNRNEVVIHPFVIGELACGNLKNRIEVLSMLQDLPKVSSATDAEVLCCIEQHQLMGRGIGHIDAHLMAATALTSPTRLWTQDKRLRTAAASLKLAYETDNN